MGSGRSQSYDETETTDGIGMLLQAEGKTPVKFPTAKKVLAVIAALRSYGPCSFASITDPLGTYLQVGGGGQTCILERWPADCTCHFRAYTDRRSKVFEDGTVLAFSGGNIPMQSDEWLAADLVGEAFCAFLEGRELPSQIRWREMPSLTAR